MRQRRPADPTDPGDAADLSIMGLAWDSARQNSSCRRPSVFPASTFAQEPLKINSFLTTPHGREGHGGFRRRRPDPPRAVSAPNRG